MRLESARSEQTRHRAVAFATAALGPDIRQVLIEPETPFAYRAGQFVNLRGPDGALRSYSLASLPDTDRYLELHVARVANGRVSAWLHDSLRPGTPLELQGPNGDACYQPGEPDRPLLAIATGTGLAPILGVVRDALEQHGHRGPIRLYHGASHPDRLYCRERLLDLKRRHGNFEYLPCLSRADATDSKPSTPTSEASTRSARACDAALADHPNLSGWRLYVCGNPGMVRTVKRRAYLSGIALADIHGDPFEFATPGTAGREALAPATCR